MALFGRKKEKERCPVCGNEISFFSGIVVRDGTICSDCEKMLRGSFDIETYYVRRLNGTVKRKSEDPLNDMTIEQIKDILTKAPGGCEVYTEENATHADVWTEDPAEYEERVDEFLIPAGK